MKSLPVRILTVWTGAILSTALLINCSSKKSSLPDSQPESKIQRKTTQADIAAQTFDATTETLLAKYSLEQLDMVSTYGTELIIATANAASVGKTKIKKVLKCDPKPGVIDGWMMPLKSLMDAKIAREQVKYLQTAADTRVKQWSQCEKNCSCGAYGTLLLGIDEATLKPADILLRDTLMKKQGELSDEATSKCAKQVGWFCDSDLHKYLKGA